MLRIGYIGYGIVGKSCHACFEYNAEHIFIDPARNNKPISSLEINAPDIVFVSVPAPTLADNSVDISIICKVFDELIDIAYEGIVVLKSTVPPADIDEISQKYLFTGVDGNRLRLVYSPEFIRAEHWKQDALKPMMIILAGSYTDTRKVEETYRRHSHIRDIERLPFHRLTFKGASLTKYAINAFLATKVVFMNQLYNLVRDELPIDGNNIDTAWESLVTVISTDDRIGTSHMRVPGSDGSPGYGGACFPKDMAALIGIDKNEHMTLIREAVLVNTQIRLKGNT